ncbi:MAG: hypothetical protein LBT37_07630 [Lactobacillaceae bacterium]|nr:hypothetical protein [Lactobacillaceae bacterium]
MFKDVLALIGIFVSVSLIVVGKDIKRPWVWLLGLLVLLATVAGWILV